ncbi:TonB-dependent receptor domain-containing protein [Shinella sp. BYT-45]|uniref:TonB-dependent receptor n=1 Tax=Shinella sp. BYT-45 TaxID=3377377 RepID=UPI0039818D2C
MGFLTFDRHERGDGYRRRGVALSISAATLALMLAAPPARAQEAADYSISAGPLDTVLARFGAASGMQLLYSSSVTRNLRSPGVAGNLTSQAALDRILAGTGLTYRLAGSNRATIEQPSAATGGVADGSTVLEPIVVSRSEGGSSVYSPYEAAAPVDYISEEQIEHFRGSSPADMFRGTPGVLSGEARNGAGSIDVNIRGMQGMGRVATTVDGAENSLQIYQGYQGISNRTYVDPDLIAGIDITKGSDAGSSGIAGTVAMRTLDAADIVEDGKRFGVRVKGGFGGNTSKPVPGSVAGYSMQNTLGGYPIVSAGDSGMDRPNLLKPTRGSGSIVAAMRDEVVDLLVGYAYRKQGNYHAGEHGPSAEPVYLGPRPYCYVSGTCVPAFDYKDYVENGGLANYRAGEEVLNTQLETKSFLAKGTVRFGDGHSIRLGYTGFRSEAGDLLASALGSDVSRATQQKQTSGTKLDTGTFRYRWDPDENDLIDLTANLWVTSLELRNPARNAYGVRPETLGLPSDFRPGSDTLMWGAEVTNKSALTFDYGTLDLTYGLSYRSEDTKPSAYTDIIEGWLNLRDARREEAASFVKAAYTPVDWLTLNGGIRYSHYWSKDRRTVANSPDQLNSKPNRQEGGFSPSVGLTLEPIDGFQLYANYSNALRFPSLFESVSAFTIIPNPALGPERASNWEIGANLRHDGLFTEGDVAMVKLGYFNWNIDDYVARAFRAFPGNGYTWYGMQVYNIDRARFSGLELSARYENGGFTAQLGASYYLNVEFCQLNGICEDKTMYGDYATNHVPPEYSVDLTLSQTFLDDRLTVGGRVSHAGPRAIGHGQVTAQGLSQFISAINWKPYTLVDVFADYKINENFTASFRVENLFDRYYVDPLGLVQQPGPGRTFYASLTAKF